MSPTFIFLNIIAGVCLLLFGLMLVRTGATRAFGSSLRDFLAKATKNRLKAFVAGLVTTVILQSSTATTMLISSFVGRGLVGVTGGLAIVLGADVGTTLVAQILTFDLSWLSPIFIIVGYFLYASRNSAGLKKQVGRIILGLGIMLMSLAMIKSGAAPLSESPRFQTLLEPLSYDMILAVFLAIILTWMFHSSLAIVLLLVSLAQTGVIGLSLGMTMVLGANIGNVFPALIAAKSDTTEAFRVPFGNLMMRIIGVLLVLPFMPYLTENIIEEFGHTAWAIVLFHMFFNIGLAILFLPFIKQVGKVVRRLTPPKRNVKDAASPIYLNEAELSTPFLALMSASRETLRLSDMSIEMLNMCRQSFRKNDETLLNQAKNMDDTIDALFLAVKSYLARLASKEMNEEESKRHFEVMSLAINIEHIGDIIDRNLLVHVKKKIHGNKKFSNEGFKEIDDLFVMVQQSLKLAQQVFISRDVKLARKLVKDKAEIKMAEVKTSKAHISRLKEGIPETMDTSSMHMDIIRDLLRVNSMITSVAYPILEGEGQLAKTRLKPSKKAEEKDKTS